MYNENGLRVQKSVDGVATNYYLHGKNVVHMTRGSDELHFFYDAQNKPAVVVYNGTAYAYLKNLQGDIVAILNGSGNAVVSYVYDAWGRPVSKTGSMASTLGTLNPFRYRSYVYDEETGLYYLRNRYFNTTICRFINEDAYSSTAQGMFSSNMYAYCENKPISRADVDGKFFFTVLGAAVGAVTGAVDAWLTGGDIAEGALAGAVSGAISGAGVDIGVAMTVTSGGTATGVALVVVAGAGALGNVAATAITADENTDAMDYVASGLIGGICNLISFGLAPINGELKNAGTGGRYLANMFNVCIDELGENIAYGFPVSIWNTLWTKTVLHEPETEPAAIAN